MNAHVHKISSAGCYIICKQLFLLFVHILNCSSSYSLFGLSRGMLKGHEQKEDLDLHHLFLEAKSILDLAVEDQNESTTGTTDDVGETTVEEGLRALLLDELGEAVEGVLVHDLARSRLH